MLESSSPGHIYKISKAALNAAMANLAREAVRDGVIVALLSPGEVRVEKVIYAGGGHLLHIERPGQTVRDVKAFLDRRLDGADWRVAGKTGLFE